MKQQTFKKEERLRSLKVIEQLFDRNNAANLSVGVYPLRFIYQKNERSGKKMPEILISVSKRNLKKAVIRNLIKRRIRESYRLNKGKYDLKSLSYLAVLFIAKENLSFELIQKSMDKFLNRISKGNSV